MRKWEILLKWREKKTKFIVEREACGRPKEGIFLKYSNVLDISEMGIISGKYVTTPPSIW